MKQIKSPDHNLDRLSMLTRSLLVSAFLIFFMTGRIQAKVEKLTPAISWEVTADGTLLIKGTGDMPDFEYDKPRYWRKKEYEGKIKKIAIGEGITSIGAYNFDNCILNKGNSLSTVHYVELPSSLTTIGIGAFGLNHIKDLVLPENVSDVGVGAFRNGFLLKSVTITSPEITIKPNAFADCKNLDEVNFNNANATLQRYAFNDDKSLVSIKNASNVILEAGLDIADVFSHTQIRSLDDKMASAEPESIPVPDGEWDIEYQDGGIAYAGTYIRLNFNGTLARDDSDKGIDAPDGYISSWGDQEEESFFKLSKPTISGDKIIVKGVGYEESRDNPMEAEFTITYNKERNSITVIDSKYPDDSTEYLDYNRLRIPETLFNTAYVGTIPYEDRGDDVIGVAFRRDGEKVVMKTTVMHPFMAPPTEIAFYSGKIVGKEIRFTRKIEELVYNLQDEDALNIPFPDWTTIESTGEPCERSISYYNPSVIYLDNIFLEP